MIQVIIAKMVARGITILVAMLIVEHFTPVNLFSIVVSIVEPILMDLLGPYIRDWAIEQFNPF